VTGQWRGGPSSQKSAAGQQQPPALWATCFGGGKQLASSGQTAASARELAWPLRFKMPNIAAMLQLVTAPEGTCAGNILLEDSQRGQWARTALDDLAQALARWGQVPLAVKARRVLWHARQRVLGPEHPDTLDSMQELAAELSMLDQNTEAVDLARQLVASKRRLLGSEHLDTLQWMANLSITLSELGNHEEAAELARQILAGRQRTLGPEHPDTVTSMSNLGEWLALLGQSRPPRT